MMQSAITAQKDLDFATTVERGYTIPGNWYTDPSIAEVERDRIWGRSWLYAGLTTEIQDPGDFLAAWAGEVPIIVVRGREGQLHAFVNSCRHRGTPLLDTSRTHGKAQDGQSLGLTEDVTELRLKGHRATFQCSYHAWTYDLDGTLRAAPRSEREPDFDKAAWGLRSVQVDTWGPMIFINADRDAAPLAETLKELPQLYDEAGVDLFAALQPREYREYGIEANWKVTVDNFNECYHCPVNHPGVAKRLDVSEGYDYFHEYEYFSWFSLKDKRDEQTGHFCFVWPNFFLTVLPHDSGAAVNWILPIDLRRSVHVRQFCFSEQVTDEEAREDMAILDQVVKEDKALCESVQNALDVGTFDRGYIMRNSEQGIYHFQKLLARSLTS